MARSEAADNGRPAAEASPRQSPPERPDPTARLTEADIVLQLAYESTFAAVTLIHPQKPFGYVPAVTLYRDGTVIAFDQIHGTRWWSRGEHRAASDLEHVHALGFAKLRSHMGDCRTTASGRSCVADAANVRLRVRRPDGTTRDLVNYAGNAAKHQAQLDAIYDRLEIIATPPPTGGPRAAQPWIPARASLFLRFAEEIEPSDREGLARALPWPLASELFERARQQSWIVVALDREQVLHVVDTLGTAGIPRTFRVGDEVVHAALVPWLPGVDHRPAIATTDLRSG